MVFWNLGAQNPPALRRAVSLAIDREQLVRSLLTWRDERFGGPAGGLLEPAGPGVPASSLADAPVPSFDPTAANRLLDEAGWSERGADGIRLRGGVPLRIQMIYDRGNELRERLATFLEEDLFRVGIQCQPVPLGGSVVWERFRSGLFDTALLGFRPPIVPDLSDLWKTRGRWNGGGYSSPRADSLLQSLNAASGEEIERLARQVEAQVRRDQPVTFLVYREECDLLSPRVRDFEGTPESPLRGLERVWLADTTEAATGPIPGGARSGQD
jgi:peptide/nickel transport system substrate-binding protein